METTFYTFRANEIVVAGDGVEQAIGGEGRRLVCVRRSAARPSGGARGRVISMEDWRAAHAPEGADWTEEAEDWREPESPAEGRGTDRPARTRTDHSGERGGCLELLASAALIAFSAAACAAFLL